ncbi:hypothetical protein P153DRAFT_363343 [Dothidotthia symphoricarpi CBS 119687]|uniref:Ribonuclease H2 subunit B n=1 Tax=Dothidotthia symphoricarpi CBS 119687 TaxID=1392245 RepID=A0A6A6APN4_9PLEO|nr:uncharacterized protein P153DRAFT_363343 [Dothidotthia symphoricarpi CBS 119687]KAF2133118.1 hypothetical protein P153DRAFT_363343 [Dothidotthia symphoricarpi CBS 119687]
MVRKTRSQPASKSSPAETSTEATATATATKSLPPSTSNPPKLFVLPKNTSKDARIVTLDNPATGTPSRYYFCPERGFHEFTRIAAPKKSCRSWLIHASGNEETKQEDGDGMRVGSGYITKDADLFIATPIDVLFLILPALAPQSAKDTKQLFLELDDYLDMLSSTSQHWKALLSQYLTLKGMMEKKVRLVCDTVDAGEQTMYRLSTPKLLDVLTAKATRMVAHGLPPSLEEKHIKTALEVPVMSIRREESTLSAISTTTPDEPSTPTVPDSETTVESSTTTVTTTSTDLPSQIPPLLRLQTSLTYLSTAYLPPTLRQTLTTHLTTSPHFLPLTTHLAHIATLKRDAAALRNISDNMSRKRAITEDEDKIAEREEKKRKKEEEEKRKKSEGRAVKQLKKVDTSGMKKMSAFFTRVGKKT